MSVAHDILHPYQYIISAPESIQNQLGSIHMAIPSFPKEKYQALFEESTKSLQVQPTVLKVESPIIVVGDIHGNIRDLFRVFWKNGVPPFTKYLFLGDYVDRGDFSLEVLTILLAMQVVYPDSIFLLRGNHEFADINQTYGFGNQLVSMYGDMNLLQEIDECYENMSIAAIIDNKYFCIHGGISSQLTLEGLLCIRKPIGKKSSLSVQELIEDIMWSDPDPEATSYLASFRGKGHRFGVIPTAEFLQRYGFDKLIRAHECVPQGVRLQFNVVTVFTSSNYSKNSVNSSGHLYIEPIKGIHFRTIPQMPQLERSHTIFHSMSRTTKLSLQSLKCSRTPSVVVDSARVSSRRSKRVFCPTPKPVINIKGESLPVLPKFLRMGGTP